MAAISLFWDTNMAVVTSCENTVLVCGVLSADKTLVITEYAVFFSYANF